MYLQNIKIFCHVGLLKEIYHKRMTETRKVFSKYKKFPVIMFPHMKFTTLEWKINVVKAIRRLHSKNLKCYFHTLLNHVFHFKKDTILLKS